MELLYFGKDNSNGTPCWEMTVLLNYGWDNSGTLQIKLFDTVHHRKVPEDLIEFLKSEMTSLKRKKYDYKFRLTLNSA